MNGLSWGDKVICPDCKENRRKLRTELAMEIDGEILSVVRSEKPICKDCLEGYLMQGYFDSKKGELEKN